MIITDYPILIKNENSQTCFLITRQDLYSDKKLCCVINQIIN